MRDNRRPRLPRLSIRSLPGLLAALLLPLGLLTPAAGGGPTPGPSAGGAPRRRNAHGGPHTRAPRGGGAPR
ncbi:hypothetical protein ACOZDF_14425, partial [Streptomyces griseoincarnatus]